MTMRLSMQCRMAIVAGLWLGSTGCYKDLDFSNIKCDLTAKPACPDGLVCSAGLCVKLPAAVDGPAAEGGMPPSDDVASIDQVVAVDQVAVLDAAKGEALPPVDVFLAMDTAADKSDDVVTSIDGLGDAPQLNLDTGLLDVGLPDASDAAPVDVGGVDAEWHPIDEFTIPTKDSKPCGLTLGFDGNLWFCECGAENIGRITPSGEIKEFPFPGGCLALVTGSDKNIWFASGDNAAGYNVGRYVASTGDIAQFPATSEYIIMFMTVGPDGNVWFTNSPYGVLGKVTPSGVVTRYTVTDSPAGILTAPDGDLWYGGYGVMVRIDGEETYTEFTVPKINGQGSVHALTIGGDGRFWYTFNDYNHRAKVGAMTTTGVTAEYVVSDSSVWPSSITKGPDGNVWFTDGDGICRITPSGQVTVVPLSSPNSSPADITLGSDGNLWFTDSGINRIGRIRP